MAEWLGNGLQNHAQQFDSAWHLELIGYYSRGAPREWRNLFFYARIFMP